MFSDPSIVIESINTYRHWLDFATLLVVIGLIGEYRKNARKLFLAIRTKDWKKSKLFALTLLFPMLVVVGVAGELSINLSVSALENSWEISQLPRTLTGPQQVDIAKALLPFQGTQFDFEMTQDLEPMVLLDEIENCLAMARWSEQSPRPGHPTFDRINRPKVAVGRTVAGVWVLWPTGNDALKKAGRALHDALVLQNITSSALEIMKPDEYDLGKVHIWVGQRPIKEYAPDAPEIDKANEPATTPTDHFLDFAP